MLWSVEVRSSGERECQVRLGEGCDDRGGGARSGQITSGLRLERQSSVSQAISETTANALYVFRLAAFFREAGNG